MPRMSPESHENIARFFGRLAGHLDDNDGVFMGDRLTPPQARAVQRILRGLAQAHDAMAEEGRSTND